MPILVEAPIVEAPIATPAAEIAPDSALRPMPQRPREAPPRRRARMLSVSTDWEDHDILADIVDETVWQLVPANTCREAMSRLSRMRIAVVLCEYSLPDGTWKDVFDHLIRIGKAAPLVVTSRLADEHLWAEVLNLGGYDVLAKPFRAREVVHAITSALLHGVRSVPRARAAGGG